ncbi:hypothetical protein ZIOFF_045511 [Zingiber officinale]|uniref:DUF659 domain-containing protein n=1 Tax=Zingiber officinale TaxID=94328 RepID=A0A8J5KYC8_ZINOF|nr:hypothetical protein ZIOFF_045511 [Zingiber officinale]
MYLGYSLEAKPIIPRLSSISFVPMLDIGTRLYATISPALSPRRLLLLEEVRDSSTARRTQQQFAAARRSPAASVASLLNRSQHRRRCLQKPGVAPSPAQQQPSQKPAATRRCSPSPAAARNIPLSPVAALFLPSALFLVKCFQNESAHEDVDDYSPLWKFVTKVEKAVGGGNVTWSCNICNKVCKGSYSRVKAHMLKQKGAGIADCTAVTMDQMKRMQQLIDDAELRKKNSKQKEVPLPSSSASSNMASKSSFCTSGYLPPGYNLLRTSLLQKEKAHIGKLLEPTKAAWKQKGVSICSDGWSDVQRRPLINIMVVCESGPMFLKAINCEGEYKDKAFISKLLINTINEVGHQNVVQVVTDNAPVCKVAGLLVEAKYPHIFWTPCVVHTLNLALKNICAPTDSLQNKEAFDECKWIAEVANDASMIKNFIMNHNMRLSMFNDNSNLKMLSLADTRFASTIIMLKRFRQIKKCLENMVISERWDLYKEDDVVKARVVKYYSHEWLQESPNRLPPHRDIEVSRKRKKCIERYYSNSSERRSVNEEFASFSTAIDDFSDNDSMRDRGLMSPTKWWVIHGASTPTLQSLALKLLGHPSSSSCYGFDSMDMEGAAILEIANLSLDELELESVLFTDEGGVGDETDMDV